MPEVTLYFAPRTRAIRALWLLEELGAPYRMVPLDYAQAEHKSPAMLALNPMGKLPVVTVDGHPVWESPAIIAHLCDLFPAAGLAPPVGTPARADYYRWLSFGTAVMEPAFNDHFHQREEVASRVGWGDFASMKAALAAGLSGRDWLVGDAFTGADLLIGGNLNWFTQWAAADFADIPGVDAYVARIRARPALARANAIEAELAANQQPPA